MHQRRPELQVLQSVREQQETQALQEYGRALKDLETINNRFESLRLQLQEARSLLALQCHQHQGQAALQEISRLRTWCDSIQRRLSAGEYAAQAARNRARLAFTRLLATRHISAILKQWEAQQPAPPGTSPADPLTAHPDLGFLRRMAQTPQTPLWN